MIDKKTADLAHLLLDTVIAQDVTAQAGDRTGAAVEAVANRARPDLGGLITVTSDVDQHGTPLVSVDIGAFVSAALAPILWSLTELAHCADITLDETVGHARAYIESQLEDD